MGTDDGLVHVSPDGGETWRAASALPEFPVDGFINNVKASQHSSDEVFVVGDAHKNGDYAPYVFSSTDQGATWQSISGDLPEGTIVWSIEQDHVNADLLFAGTEYGLYVTLNRGVNWHRLESAPTIAFRDVVIQRRDRDVVGATFGRGIYVLDDYTALRTLNDDQLAAEAALFETRDAWWYVPHQTAQSEGQPTLGSSAFAAPNPDFGATFTYHLANDLLSAKKQRRSDEKPDGDMRPDIQFPGWEALWEEHVETDPVLFLLISAADDTPIRRLVVPAKKGLQRASWDLRLAAPDPVKLDKPEFTAPWETPAKGPLVKPGTYHAQLVVADADGPRPLGEKQSFEVTPIPAVADHPDLTGTIEFWHEAWELQRQVLAAAKHLTKVQTRIKEDRVDLERTPDASPDDFVALDARHRHLEEQLRALQGDPVRGELHEATTPSIKERVGRIAYWETTQPPTTTQRESLAIAQAAFNQLEIPDLT